MDFLLDADQQAILAAVDTITARHAGATRMRALGGDEPAYDHDLHKHLAQAGYLDLGQEGRRLDAALVVEAVAGKLGVVAAGYHALVLPSLGLDVEGPIAIVPEGSPGSARFAADAEVVVGVGVDRVCVMRPTPARSIGCGRGRDGRSVTPRTSAAATCCPAWIPTEIRAWWRIALAAELVGSMRAALDLTVAHVSDRFQFGRPIGSFQAVQHGLAKCAVAIEGRAGWPTRRRGRQTRAQRRRRSPLR